MWRFFALLYYGWERLDSSLGDGRYWNNSRFFIATILRWIDLLQLIRSLYLALFRLSLCKRHIRRSIGTNTLSKCRLFFLSLCWTLRCYVCNYHRNSFDILHCDWAIFWEDPFSCPFFAMNRTDSTKIPLIGWRRFSALLGVARIPFRRLSVLLEIKTIER